MSSTLRVLYVCLFAIVSALAVAGSIAYCCGRWHIVPGLEIPFAELFGLIAGVYGAGKLMALFKKTFHISVVFFLVFLVACFFWMAHVFLIRAYAAGFERAVFGTASVEQWGGDIVQFKKWLANYSSGFKSQNEFIPDFARRVYPDQHLYISIYTNTIANDNYLLFWWRGGSFSPGVQIGNGGQYPHNVLYRRQYSNGVTILLFGGD